MVTQRRACSLTPIRTPWQLQDLTSICRSGRVLHGDRRGYLAKTLPTLAYLVLNTDGPRPADQERGDADCRSQGDTSQPAQLLSQKTGKRGQNDSKLPPSVISTRRGDGKSDPAHCVDSNLSP